MNAVTRHEAQTKKGDLWAALAAPLPRHALQWRLDSTPKEKNGRFYARAVCWADVPVIWERFDSVVPGEWDLSAGDPKEFSPSGGEVTFYVKARITVLGVIREDVGQGPDPKQAMTDAIKRCARMFGVGIELWTMGAIFVTVDGPSKYAKIVGDPWVEYERQKREPRLTAAASDQNVRDLGARAATPVQALPQEEYDPNNEHDARRPGYQGVVRTPAAPAAAPEPRTPAMPPADGAIDPEQVACPKCGGRTWDNRLTKKNPKAPDFKCRDRNCDGVIWPPRAGTSTDDEGTPVAPPKPPKPRAGAGAAPIPQLEPDEDELPF